MVALAEDWVDRCLAIGGDPTLEQFDEAVASGRGALPVMAVILARADWRDGDASPESRLSLHAIRILGVIAEPAAIPMLASVLRDPRDPARHGDEAALALARIGGDALRVLQATFADHEHDAVPHDHSHVRSPVALRTELGERHHLPADSDHAVQRGPH